MTRRRRIAWIAAVLAALLVLAAIAAVAVLRSDWFLNQVRLKLIATIETATGGRVEIGSFTFDWRRLRAEVRGLVVHGTEPSDRPPLLRVSSVAVGLKLVSITRRDIDLQSLEVNEPRIQLIVAPDGRTNVPEPKVKSSRSTLDGLLDAAIGRFAVDRGVAEVEGHGETPFSFRGENLAVKLGYEAKAPRYTGTIAVAPLSVKYDDFGPEPVKVNLALTIERNRVAVDSGKLILGGIQVDLGGALENLASPRAKLQYSVRAPLREIDRIFRVPEVRQGAAVVTGNGEWTPDSGFSLTGTLHATGVEYRDSTIRLAGFRVEGAVSAGPAGVGATNLALAGDYVHDDRHERLEGRIARFTLFHKDIDMHGVDLDLLNGTFTGDARLRGLDRYTVEGTLSGVDTRRAVALYSPEALPWDALVSGPLVLEGSLRNSQALRATARFTVAPAPSSDPVNGQVNAVYEARDGGILGLGNSTINLPHSRAALSGSIGHDLRVHAETRDLNDLLPALGMTASTLPFKLNNGSAVFDGTVSGNLANPRIAGHVRATSFTLSEEPLDSAEADVQVSADYVRAQNAVALRGPLRAQLSGSVGLSGWKTSDYSPVSVITTVTNAAATDVLNVAHVKDVPLTGTIGVSAQANGVLGKLRAQADITAVKGTLYNEPFDRFFVHATYADDTLDLSGGQLTAGTKQLKVSANYRHAPGRLDVGRARFQLTTNPSKVEEIQRLAEERPDIKGTMEVSASGEVEFLPSTSTPYRIRDLQADVTAKGVQFEEQPVGDAHLTATSQGGVLRAHLESTIAGASVRGDGEWRLEGEYPGSAAIQFTKVDLAHLKDWLMPAEEPVGYTGSAEGELRIDGPLERWQALKAELRIRQFQISATPAPGYTGPSPAIRNSGDLVFRYANSTVQPESAHFTGPGTDLQLSGRIQTGQKSPLDLRVEGSLDLAFLHDFFPDFTAAGGVSINAGARGSFSDPQIVGRVEFQKASFNITDVPNGISNATGAIVFNKDRATIQRLTGDTGGGRIELSGFAGYGGAYPTVFRLHARFSQVRVRYPEGVSNVLDASLNLTGTSESSVLAGNITVLRTSINLQSDFSSILAKSAQPVRTPSAQTGLLGGMSFDVQVDTSPDIQVQSSLAEEVQVEANLKLRGTATNPAVLGRINITQGKLSFFGTQYTFNQGSISFFNPVKIDPILAIDLETKVRGIDIILTVSGPLNKLTLTPRSDPPLQFSEIVSLLATGRSPTSDPSLWTQQSTSQSWSQMGASALLGSAIANPVAGRLQRFFGVSRLRIDPTITGVENSPQARVTLEQQITPSLTFTYIANVTSSNPQVIRIEWAFARQWSAVALREENGLFGLDFFYKRRFK